MTDYKKTWGAATAMTWVREENLDVYRDVSQHEVQESLRCLK